MMATRLTLIVLCGLFVTQLCAQNRQSVQFIKTLKDSLKSDSSFYNVFVYDGKYILLKDTIGFDTTGINAADYMFGWATSGKPVEADNFFLFDSELKKLKKSERKSLSNFGFRDATFCAGSYAANREEFLEVLTDQYLSLIAIVYECKDDHKGGPHSGANHEELTKKYGCTKFKVRIAGAH